MIDVGFKNYILKEKIIRIKKPGSSLIKMLINEATLNNRLIDCTHGKKTQCILILDTNHIVLSAIKHSSIQNKIKTDPLSVSAAELTN